MKPPGSKEHILGHFPTHTLLAPIPASHTLLAPIPASHTLLAPVAAGNTENAETLLFPIAIPTDRWGCVGVRATPRDSLRESLVTQGLPQSS